MAKAYECDLCGTLVKEAPTYHKVTTLQPSLVRPEHKWENFQYEVKLWITKTRHGDEDATLAALEMEVCSECMAKAIIKAAKELPQNKGETK